MSVYRKYMSLLSSETDRFSRTTLFYDVTQAYSGNSLPMFRDNLEVETSALEDGTDRLSRNVGKELPLYAE